MPDITTDRLGPSQLQWRRHADELRAVLPLVESLAEQVSDLHQERRIDATSALLCEAATHLARAWSQLKCAFDLADEAGRSPTADGEQV